jgi:hypothetical protein
MILRLFGLGRFAALLLCGLAFGAAPAAADGCGYGCYQPAPVVVQPVQPCCYQPCSCCGCGSSYYSTYYAAYTYPSTCCGGYAGYGWGYGYGAGYAGEALAPPVLRPRVVAPPYWGPRRSYWGPRRYVGGRLYARYR